MTRRTPPGGPTDPAASKDTDATRKRAPRAAQPRRRRSFGRLRQLPNRSRRWQASYIGPDLVRHNAPTTFETRTAGEAWLASELRIIERDEWTPPTTRARARLARGLTLAEWAPDAIGRRRVRGQPLKPRTQALYRSQLSRLILPSLGDLPLRSITPEHVRDWWDGLAPSKPTQAAHAYQLLHGLMAQAVDEGLLTATPVHIKGAQKVARAAHSVTIATPAEIDAIAGHMPPRLALLVHLAGWCGLRYGELAELRRGDVDLDRGVIVVSRAYTRANRADVIGPPKSAAGVRTVTIPPHLLPLVAAHLRERVGPASDALVFARDGNRHLTHTTVTQDFIRARTAAGRPDLHLHDLRHTAGTLAAMTGASLAELMARLGHSTATASLRYQHAAAGRDAAIAAALSRMATPTTPATNNNTEGEIDP